ncbi:MAG: hypothetical protein J7K98_04385 [Candidatus Aenigmarchaeota archaeon]|nr:hypothetical protein [Candidatus Aenigmarchaeota archaeon]
MTIERILIQEVRKEAERLIQQKKEEFEKWVEEEKRKIKKEREVRLKKFEEELERKKLQALQSARLEGKLILLKARDEAIEDVFQKFKQKLRKLDKKTYSKLLKKLLEESLEKIGKKKIVVHVRKGEKKLLPKIKGVSIKVVEDLKSSLGGLIVEDEKGEVRIDATLDSVIEEMKESYLKDISNILFGGEKK